MALHNLKLSLCVNDSSSRDIMRELFLIILLCFTLTTLLQSTICAAALTDFDEDRLRIGSFNIQVFGVKKVKKEGVLKVLTDVSLCLDIKCCIL